MRDLDDVFKQLDRMPAPDVRAEARRRMGDDERPMPSLGMSRTSQVATIVVAILVFTAAAAFAWRIASNHGARPADSNTPPPTPSVSVVAASTVYFAWPGEITEVDVATGNTKTFTVHDLGGGDPPVYLTRLGGRLAYWGNGASTFDPQHPSEAATSIARGSLIFVPSATPGRIWAIWKDEAASTPYRFEFSHLREIDGDGTVTAEGPAHGGDWLDGAVTAGVLLETKEGLIVWNPDRAEVVARIPDAPSAAATFDNTVVWCVEHCPQVHLTEITSGDDRIVDPPAGYPWFAAWDGTFSPDGSTFAVPVSSTPRTGPGSASAVALVDVASGSVTGIIPGSDTTAGCCDLSWDSTGERLYVARYEASDGTEGWRLSYWDVGATTSVDTSLGVPHAVGMVAG
jgi:hypothetical protein